MDVFRLPFQRMLLNLIYQGSLTHWTTSSLLWLTPVCFCVSFPQGLDPHISTPPSASWARCWMSWPSYGCSCAPSACGSPRDTYLGCSGGIGMSSCMILPQNNLQRFRSLTLAFKCVNIRGGWIPGQCLSAPMHCHGFTMCANVLYVCTFTLKLITTAADSHGFKVNSDDDWEIELRTLMQSNLDFRSDASTF